MGPISEPGTWQLSHVTPPLATGETPFFSCLCKGHQFAPASTDGTYAILSWGLSSGCINLEMHHLALAIAKKLLDENRFRIAQKATHQPAANFKIGDRNKNLENGI